MKEQRHSSRIDAELKTYKDKVNVHDLPDIFHYWSNKYIKPKLQRLGISDIPALFGDPIARLAEQTDRVITVASLGSGNCDLEITITKRLLEQGYKLVEMHCYEINQDMLNRGREHAENEKISDHFEFINCDVNVMMLDQKYDIFMAQHSLHHFVKLEHIFETVCSQMKPGGYFIVSDMIGRNGHMRWPEAYRIVCDLWRLLPDKYKWNHQLKRHEGMYDNWDCSKEGFEGIRSQDILPLLMKHFRFELFYAFGNVIDIFVGRSFGPNFDPDNPFDTAFIDFVAHLDEKAIAEGVIKPTHLIARMTLENPSEVKVINGLTPEYCVRRVY